MKIVFATHNSHKLSEVKSMLPPHFELLGLDDIKCHEDIPEIGATLEENAKIKSSYVFEHYGQNCFADDTGLEVETLNNAPGVYSARYAGNKKNDGDNIQKLLKELKYKAHRKARFKTVISLYWNREHFVFEGIVKGTILEKPVGNRGFGYDAVFLPDGSVKSFAEMSFDEKNEISHRKIAVKKLVDFLKNLENQPS